MEIDDPLHMDIDEPFKKFTKKSSRIMYSTTYYVLFILFIFSVFFFAVCTLKTLEYLLIYVFKWIPVPTVHPYKASEEVLQMWGLACEISMRFFINMVNKTHHKFTMLEPILFQEPKVYSFLSIKDKDDIQIFYVYTDENSKKLGYGHFISAYYDSNTKKVWIYDSLVNSYTDENKRFIESNTEQIHRLYPEHLGFVWKRPKNIQTDNVSCGVYAIAYTLLLLDGKDPEQQEIIWPIYTDKSNDVIFLRKFISIMFQTNRLWKFVN